MLGTSYSFNVTNINKLFLLANRIEIQIEYFEKDGGIFTKVLEMIVSAKDVPLTQTFHEESSLEEVGMRSACVCSCSLSLEKRKIIPNSNSCSVS